MTLNDVFFVDSAVISLLMKVLQLLDCFMLLVLLMYETAIGTLEDDRTVLYKIKSLDGTKPNTNPACGGLPEHRRPPQTTADHLRNTADILEMPLNVPQTTVELPQTVVLFFLYGYTARTL